MVKFYFKVIFRDDSFGYEYFRAKDKLEAYAKLKYMHPDAREFVRLTEEEYNKETEL